MIDKYPHHKKYLRAPFAVSIIAALLVFTGALAAGEILDPNFGTNGVVTTSFGGLIDGTNHVVLQADGKIIVSGYYQTSTPFVARYNSNGTVDATFGTNGILLPSTGSQTAIQSDGKLLVAGSSNGDLAVARYNSNGTSLDNTFGSGGVASFPSTPGWDRYSFSDLAIESNGKIVLAGTQYNQGNFINLVLVRFNSDGTPYETDFSGGLIILDHPNFPNSRYNYAQAVAVQSDGKIVMSGGMMDEDGKGQISLVRFNQDSSLDTATFGTNGKGTATAAVPGFYYHKSSMLLQTDGKIVVVGTASDVDDLHNDLVVARFNSNGELDSTFGGTGIVITDLGNNEYGSDLVIQPDGKIILVGKIFASNFSDLLLVRYNSDGSLDDTFGIDGKIATDFGNLSDSGNGIDLQPNGLIVLAGSSNGKALLARYILDVSNRPVFSASFKSSGGHDGWILESGENTNSGGLFSIPATTINVGDDLKDKQYRGILSFNTASIPDGAVVTTAHLDIMRQGVVGTDPFTTHDDLLLDIRTGTFSNNLALQLSDFNAARTPGTSQEHVIPLTSRLYTAQISSTNLRFINKYGFTQIRLLFTLDDNDDLGADYIKFFSGDSIDANRPRLIISYFVP